MPYITQSRRDKLAEPLLQLIMTLEADWAPGDLNYVITQLCGAAMDPSADVLPLNYESLALLTGVLENVKQELYRRLAGPYEDRKMKENGDVGYGELLK